MSEDELRSQISAKEDEITKIEEEANKKEASAEKEVEGEYDAQITAAEGTLAADEKARDEAIEKAAEWLAVKKEKITAAKLASKEVATLTKGKAGALKLKLKDIIAGKKADVKAVQTEIKALNKQLSALQKLAAQ